MCLWETGVRTDGAKLSVQYLLRLFSRSVCLLQFLMCLTQHEGVLYIQNLSDNRCRIHAPFSFALHLRISVIFLKRNGILYLSQQIRFCWRCCYWQVMKNEYLPRNPMLKKNIPTFIFSWFYEEKGYRSYKWTFHTDISSQIVPYYIIAGDYLWVGWGFLMYRFWRISY